MYYNNLLTSTCTSAQFQESISNNTTIPMYTTLRDELDALVAANWSTRQARLPSHAGAGALPPLPAGQLRNQVRDVWARLAQQEPSSSKRAEVIRSTMDLVGRDLAVRPVVNLDVGRGRLC